MATEKNGRRKTSTGRDARLPNHVASIHVGQLTQNGNGRSKKRHPLYIGERKDGKRHGRGKCVYSELSFYEGQWMGNHRNGWGEMHYENGDVYVGDWLVDLRHGEGITHYQNGNWYEGEWRCDKKHGEGKMYFADKGQLYNGKWRNGDAQGGTLSEYGR